LVAIATASSISRIKSSSGLVAEAGKRNSSGLLLRLLHSQGSVAAHTTTHITRRRKIVTDEFALATTHIVDHRVADLLHRIATDRVVDLLDSRGADHRIVIDHVVDQLSKKIEIMGTAAAVETAVVGFILAKKLRVIDRVADPSSTRIETMTTVEILASAAAAVASAAVVILAKRLAKRLAEKPLVN